MALSALKRKGVRGMNEYDVEEKWMVNLLGRAPILVGGADGFDHFFRDG